MKASQSQCMAALALLSSVASAVPLSWPSFHVAKRAAQPQAAYSIVAVDGGSSTSASAAAPATKTVTDAITHVQTATQVQTATVLSTIVASAADVPASVETQIISQTVTMATTIVETPSAVAPATATVTVESGVTSVPFDNGQWHTTYYFKSTVTPSIDVNAVATPTTAVDLGQWAAWSEKGSGK